MSYTYKWPRPSVTVDCVVFGLHQEMSELQVLLIERKDEPFKGSWAFPGGFAEVRDDGDQGEDLEVAARRELREETGIEVDYLEQLCTVGTPGRDPRGRVITVTYYALVRSKDHVAKGGDDAKTAQWFSMKSRMLSGFGHIAKTPLAFDHSAILEVALRRLQGKVRYAPVGFNLLPQKFTLSELQGVYETILMRTLDKRNFRRWAKRMLDPGILLPAGMQQTVPHRAAALYRFDKRAYDKAARDGFTIEM